MPTIKVSEYTYSELLKDTPDAINDNDRLVTVIVNARHYKGIHEEHLRDMERELSGAPKK